MQIWNACTNYLPLGIVLHTGKQSVWVNHVHSQKKTHFTVCVCVRVACCLSETQWKSALWSLDGGSFGITCQNASDHSSRQRAGEENLGGLYIWMPTNPLPSLVNKLKQSQGRRAPEEVKALWRRWPRSKKTTGWRGPRALCASASPGFSVKRSRHPSRWSKSRARSAPSTARGASCKVFYSSLSMRVFEDFGRGTSPPVFGCSLTRLFTWPRTKSRLCSNLSVCVRVFFVFKCLLMLG